MARVVADKLVPSRTDFAPAAERLGSPQCPRVSCDAKKTHVGSVFGVRNFVVLTKSRGFPCQAGLGQAQFAPSRPSLDAENPNLTALLSTGMEGFYHPEVLAIGRIALGRNSRDSFQGHSPTIILLQVQPEVTSPCELDHFESRLSRLRMAVRDTVCAKRELCLLVRWCARS
jgi:hypothetical protein